MFSSRCFTEDVPGIGSITGERCRSHARSSARWWRRASLRRRRAVRQGVRVCPQLPGTREKAEVVFGAVVDDIFVLTVAEVVLILHADDLDDLARLIYLVRLYFGRPT